MKALSLLLLLILLVTGAASAQDSVRIASVGGARTLVTERGDTIVLIGVKVDDARRALLDDCIEIAPGTLALLFIDHALTEPASGPKPRYVFLPGSLDLNLSLIQQGCALAAAEESGERYSRAGTFRQAALYAKRRTGGAITPAPSAEPQSPSTRGGTASSGRAATGSSSSEPASVQCTGTTKKGARCSRMTTSANARCHQH